MTEFRRVLFRSAAEKIEDGTAVNLGTNERTRVIDAVREVLRYTGKDHLPVLLDRKMPTGPMNRVADNALAKKLLGWEPKMAFRDGLRKTMDWYAATHQQEKVRGVLEKMLTAR